MQCYKIEKLLNNHYNIITNNDNLDNIIPNKFQDKINIIKDKLEKTKTLQDKYFLDYNFTKIVSIYDPFKKEKHKISNLNGTQNVTNAWIKCFEIMNKFKFINEKYTNDEFVLFDNAAFPGSFILSINHYVNSLNINIKFKWYASSFLSKTNNILEDSFNLYKNYRKNWLMNNEYNGDVRDIKNINYYESKIKNKVDLYTSDLGFENNDYNNQEKEHIHANFGQIYSGLLLLKKGGNLVTKQYTFFEHLNINIIGILTILFENVYIVKPIASKLPNSEIYIIGENFLGPWIEDSKEYILMELIKDKIINFNLDPIISINNCNYIISLINIIDKIYEMQIYSIKDRLNWYEKVKNSKNIKLDASNIIKESHENIINIWYKNNKIDINNNILIIKSIY